MAGHNVVSQVEVISHDVRGQRLVDDFVTNEVPISFVYNNTSHAVMLATPQNLNEYALGFSISEGIVQSPEEFLGLDIDEIATGIVLSITISAQCHDRLSKKSRSTLGASGCGLCGTRELSQAIRKPPPVVSDVVLSGDDISQILAALSAGQSINARTGSVHAAGLIVDGLALSIMEDVGRHNALDKVIGALLYQGIEPSKAVIAVTSRASYEMVFKAATAGVGILIAVSAPTKLAIDTAREANLTLIGWAREDRYVVYTHPFRVAQSTGVAQSAQPDECEKAAQVAQTTQVTQFTQAKAIKETSMIGVLA